MRSILGKALRAQFDGGLKTHFASFKVVSKKHPAYAWSLSDDVSVFVLLQISDKVDSFMVLTGYGSSAEVPCEHASMDPGVVLVSPGMVRLPYFFAQPYRDIWWDVDPKNYFQDPECIFQRKTPDEECLARIPRLLDDVFQKLELYAVPYWANIARRHGAAMELNATNKKA